jgi:hypothetical protein
MRLVVSLTAAMVAMCVSGSVFACGGSTEQTFQQPVIVVEQPRENFLLVRARQLESAASDRQMQANRDEQRAATLEMQARQLRMLANQIDGVDRSNLIITAGELGLAANQAKRRAQINHAQARQLTAQASQLRMQVNGVVAQPMRKPHRAVAMRVDRL